MINLRRIFDAAVREGFRKALDAKKLEPGMSDDSLPSHPGADRPSRPANLEMDSLGGRS